MFYHASLSIIVDSLYLCPPTHKLAPCDLYNGGTGLWVKDGKGQGFHEQPMRAAPNNKRNTNNILQKRFAPRWECCKALKPTEPTSLRVLLSQRQQISKLSGTLDPSSNFFMKMVAKP